MTKYYLSFTIFLALCLLCIFTLENKSIKQITTANPVKTLITSSDEAKIFLYQYSNGCNGFDIDNNPSQLQFTYYVVNTPSVHTRYIP